MTKYIAVFSNEVFVAELGQMPAGATVVAEAVTAEEDPLCLLRDPAASPRDFWWPENMFGGKPVRFSELLKLVEAVT